MYIYYVYQYLREDLTPYYIGKGKNKRAWGKHLNNKTPTNKDLIQIVAHNLSEHEAFLLEAKLIAHYGRKNNGTGILRNLTDGGEGVSGYKHREETKKLMTANNTGTTRNFSDDYRKYLSEKVTARNKTIENKERSSRVHKGKIVSEETRATISAGRKGIPAHNKGIPMPQTAKEKQRLSKQGKPWSEARRAAQLKRSL